MKDLSKKSAQLLKGVTIWFTGLSGSGKSTIATALVERLKAWNLKTELLDGDEVRTHLSKDLGFSRQDRDTNIKRIGFVCHLLTRNGVIAVASAISPYRVTREYNRKMIGQFVEVYVNTPFSECEKRDVKGLYKKARAGEIKEFTGLDDPYEAPESPEVICDTLKNSLEACVNLILSRLEELGYLKFADAGAK